MREIQTIGIDLAKHSFYVYGVDANGKKSLGKTLSRGGVALFFSNLPACIVGMKPVLDLPTGRESYSLAGIL